MKKIAFITPILFFISSCATHEEKEQRNAYLKQLSNSYYACVVSNARTMDDGKSAIGDIATAAVYACQSSKKLLMDELVPPMLRRDPIAYEEDLKFEKSAYSVAVRALSEKRKIK